MTRKRSLTSGLFGMPSAIVEAALEQLTPVQRTAIKSEHAARIMRVAIDTAEKIGAIVEGAEVAARPFPPEAPRDAGL